MTAFGSLLPDRRRVCRLRPLALLMARASTVPPDLDIAGYERRLLALSQSLEVRIHPAADVRSQLAELHKLLYDECAFRRATSWNTTTRATSTSTT